MNLIEINNLIRGKFGRNPKIVKLQECATKEDLDFFRSLLAISESYIGSLQRIEVASEFYDAYELFKKSIPVEKQAEMFYAAKLGFVFDNVPSRLVYILNKAIKTYDTVNVAISSIDNRILQKFLDKGSLHPDIIIKDVVDSLYGKDTELITNTNRKVKADDETYEIYVQNTDRVVVVPADIANCIESREDLENINFKDDLGVCLYDKPLRTFNGRLGITYDDYDLRECR